MRIAVITPERHKLGGHEQYLDALIPELDQLGHEVGLWHEIEGHHGRARISLGPANPSWSVEQLGVEPAIAALRGWRPDVLYCHGMLTSAWQRRLLECAPGVYFAHAYHGACISGLKAFAFPRRRPCSRPFGWPCLLHYFPHRCGGLDPRTMWRLYRREKERLEVLSRYAVILTHSTFAREQYARLGLNCRTITFCVMEPEPSPQPLVSLEGMPRMRHQAPDRILFLGRMEPAKGGDLLLDALPVAQHALGRPLKVVWAGDGFRRQAWQKRAAQLPGISSEFPGWIDRADLPTLFARTDLLVVPSLWPEPFGMVGPEAGRYGVPAAAFRVGGIPNWLEHGSSGYLAPADPPTAEGLAGAIVGCLRDPEEHARLREGARRLARRFTLLSHLAELVPVLEEAARNPNLASARR